MTAMSGLLGLVIGSFLNVVVHRVPRGESLVAPPSRCPACGHGIRNRHNLPVLGWIVLRGRCADCSARISPRYPLVEALTGVVFLVLAARLDALDVTSALPAYLWFAAAGIALAMIDLDTQRLPSSIVLPSYPVIGALLAVSAGVEGSWWPFTRAVLGGAALFAFFLVLVLLRPGAMGFGDVKLAGLVGGVLGYLSWAAVIVGGFAAFLLGAVVGVAVMATGRGSRKTALPFGPFMVAGALLGILASGPIADAYFELIGR